MYLKTTKRTQGKKTYECHLLVEGYRDEKGRSASRVLLNVTSWTDSKREALSKILKGEGAFSISEVQTIAGRSIGAIHVFAQLAHEIEIDKAIRQSSGNTFLSRVLLLLTGRILTQGSRRKLLDWSQTQEVEEILSIDPQTLTTDDLYETLDYLADHQEEIERKLFTLRTEKTGKIPRIYLYDVTSSYLEGEQNELASYGYNRDKKKGKKQIVIGLLTDEEGYPIAIRVFTGNTLDPKTVHAQIQKLADSFGVREVIFVGDKGMIKTAQIAELSSLDFHYITTITKPQIRTLIQQGHLQLSLFDEKLAEIIVRETGGKKEGRTEGKTIRYIFRRNPVRAEEIQKIREEKQEKVQQLINKTNIYLKEHPKAKTATAHKTLLATVKRLCLPYLTVVQTGRAFSLCEDQEQRTEAQSLDGCFVIKTDCLDRDLSKETIHDRYKDLKNVEYAFRTIKTGFLEVRPIFLRKAKRTRGHVFVTMLSYLLIHEFKKRTKDIKGTLEHKVDTLDAIQTVTLTIQKQTIKKIPQQPDYTQQLLTACAVSLPTYCRN